ncbi:MAG: fasciclin domain-containing protein [Bacteroidota bacterium]
MKLFSAGMLMLAALLIAQPIQAQCNSSKHASNGSNVSTSAYGGRTAHSKDIIDLAVGTDVLSTLVAAVKAADLVSTLKGDGPFTVFAPTNDAFNALPKGTVANLLKPENKDQLVNILTYHVVPGKILSTDLGDGQRAATVQGSKVKVTLTEGGVLIDNARVINADVTASNGVVHVIDRVILPPAHH